MGLEQIRFFYDSFDIGIYFRESAWILTSAPPRSELPFGYPPLAQLLFGAMRLVANGVLGPSESAFAGVWVGIAATLLVLAVVWTLRIIPATRWQSLAVWVTPASLYFALYRFDLFPAIATLAAYYLIRENRLLAGSLVLGLAIALKGYALYLLPALYYYIAANRGHKTAISALLLAIAPLCASVAGFLALAGVDETLKPFGAQAMRGFNGESSYDAVAALAGIRLSRHVALGGWSRLIQLAQWGAALGVLLTRPQTFKAFAAASLFVLIAFLTLSPYYSPQYVLWLLPVACFVEDRFVNATVVAMGWITYLYFPVAYDSQDGRDIWIPPLVFILLVARIAASGRAWLAASASSSPRPT
jgi:uncharacterized membrane protein